LLNASKLQINSSQSVSLVSHFDPRTYFSLVNWDISNWWQCLFTQTSSINWQCTHLFTIYFW